jgi:hypothetical protein
MHDDSTGAEKQYFALRSGQRHIRCACRPSNLTVTLKKNARIRVAFYDSSLARCHASAGFGVLIQRDHAVDISYEEKTGENGLAP